MVVLQTAKTAFNIAALVFIAPAFIGGAFNGLSWRGGAGARLGDERLRLDRGHRRVSRPVNGRAQPGPLHDYRDHVDRHDHGNATNAALGVRAAAAPARRERANRARRVRGARLRQQYRASVRRRRRQRERSICLAPGRAAIRLAMDLKHCPAARIRYATRDGRARSTAAEKVEFIIEDAARIESAHAGSAVTLVDITMRLQEELTGRAIAEEARKGYDLLLVGVESAVTADGEIDEKVMQIAPAFEGSFAIAVARGSHRRKPSAASGLDALVPVTGAGHSRRGAEIALALARASARSRFARGEEGTSVLAPRVARQPRRKLGKHRHQRRSDPPRRRPPRRSARRAGTNRGPQAGRCRRGHPAPAGGRGPQSARHGRQSPAGNHDGLR